MDLKERVKAKIRELGVKQAARFYGVSTGTISNWASGQTSPSVDAVEMTIEESSKDPNSEDHKIKEMETALHNMESAYNKMLELIRGNTNPK